MLIEYRVQLSPDQVRARMAAECGRRFVGKVDEQGFSLVRRRSLLSRTGRVMTGVLEGLDSRTSVIRISFKASLWARFTIVWFFTVTILMQVIFLLVLIAGVRNGSSLQILLGLFPLLLGLVGYIELCSGRWTDRSSEKELLRALEDILGDAKI
jgi:hypothetical protein